MLRLGMGELIINFMGPATQRVLGKKGARNQSGHILHHRQWLL